VWGAYWQD